LWRFAPRVNKAIFLHDTRPDKPNANIEVMRAVKEFMKGSSNWSFVNREFNNGLGIMKRA